MHARRQVCRHIKESLAAIANISFRRIDSLDDLKSKQTNSSATFLVFIDGRPRLALSQSMAGFDEAIVWDSELEMWLINALRDGSRRYPAAAGRQRLPKGWPLREQESHCGILKPPPKTYLPHSAEMGYELAACVCRATSRRAARKCTQQHYNGQVTLRENIQWRIIQGECVSLHMNEDVFQQNSEYGADLCKKTQQSLRAVLC